MSDFNFYKSKELYREKYYQMPKVFFTNKKYFELSNDAKIAYMLLKDRFDYSVKNNWVDEDDNIYFIFTVTELMNLLHCREGKVSKIKKELEQVGLLKQKKGRINNECGKIKATPNRLYLGKPEVTSEDIFAINQEDSISTVNAKIANTVKDLKINDYTVSAKIANTAKPSNTNSSTVNAKIADNLFYSSSTLDTNRHSKDTREADQNSILLENFVDLMQDSSVSTFIPVKVLNLIKTFSNTFEEAQQAVKIIHNAKFKAEQEADQKFVFEELENYGVDTNELYITMLKAYQKEKTEEVNNLSNLIFIYVKNWFKEQAAPAVKAYYDQDFPDQTRIPMHDWSTSEANI
ncbi:replication initiator protein A [Enterococcus sp. FDAARGOS_375]|uniref:replication initiator protein A n=1 Tax=Enterococcus sp. FDAARGOS_375 TaxID=2060307 RepID=UPI000BBD10D7|nr:replication initiator protein A [Enterococcus sp. FDAARGOS_375]ATF70576.1 replication protein RepA [Enterococcus sp. FDAARGOS_375]